MAGRIIQLSEPRRIVEPPFIDTSIRADLGDYGPPGWHLHGPVALKGRRKASSLGIPGATDGPGAGDLDAQCGLPPRGDGMHVTQSVAASTTTVIASGPFPLPFVITHVYARDDQTTLGDHRILLKVAGDDDTTGGLNTAGTAIGRPVGGSSRFNTGTQPIWFYPNFRVVESGQFIKTIFENVLLGPVIFQVDVSLLFVD